MSIYANIKHQTLKLPCDFKICMYTLFLITTFGLNCIGPEIEYWLSNQTVYIKCHSVVLRTVI